MSMLHPILLFKLTLVLALLPVGLLVYVVRRMNTLREAQDADIASLRGADRHPWHRVVVARAPHFARTFSKLLPYEARGVLVQTPDGLRVLATPQDGTRIDQCFANDNGALTWRGDTSIAGGKLHWFSLGRGAQTLYLSADTGLSNLQSRQATADIFRQIAHPAQADAPPSRDFALEKNPASLLAMLAFFLLIGFAGLDGAVLNLHETVGRTAALHGSVGLAALFGGLLLAVPLYFGLTRTAVPARESIALALLVTMGIQLAAWPAAKRMDQWAAHEPERLIAYRLESGTHLVPLEPGPPALDFPRSKEYWAQFPRGSVHQFVLQRGALGLWQHNSEAFYARVRAFYEAHPEIH